MAKRRNGKREVAKDSTQTKAEEHWIDAMPIRIDFRTPRSYVTPEVEGEDVRFSPCFDPAKEGGAVALKEYESENSYEVESRDAYKILHDFLAVDSHEKALDFLRCAGEFWPLYSLKWSEFQRWQDFVRLVGQSDFPDFAAKDSDTHQAWAALNGLPNTFFPVHNEKPTAQFVTRFIARSIELDPSTAEVFASAERAANERDAKAVLELPQAFRKPPESALSIEYDPTDRTEFFIAIEDLANLEHRAARVFTESQHAVEPAKKERPPAQYEYIRGLIERAKIVKENAAKELEKKAQQAEMRRATGGPVYFQSEDIMPVLHIRTRNVLEAIAATVCAYRWHGLRTRICQHCRNHFVLTDPRSMYCSKRCKNAATTKATRDRARKRAGKSRSRMPQSG